MPNNKKQTEKRGVGRATKKVTKMVQKAFELNRRRAGQASGVVPSKHLRKPIHPKDRVPPAQLAHYAGTRSASSASSSHGAPLTSSDVRDAAKGSALITPVLAGGLTAAALMGQSRRDKSTTTNTTPFSFNNPLQTAIRGDMKARETHPMTVAGDHPRVEEQGINIFEAPVRIGTKNHGRAPKMWAKARAGDVEVIVEHTEYLADLVSLGGSGWPNLTNIVQYPINPGQTTVFPWLSTLAKNFDEYKFDKLEFSFDPLLGTGANGKIVATFDPDVLDEFPDTKQDALEARIQLDDSVWMTNKMKVPADLLADYLFVRPGALPAGADQHVYDVGVLNLGLPGVAAGSAAELFVTYRVRLRTPNGGQRFMGGQAVVTGPTSAQPIGTALTVTGNVPVQWKDGSNFLIGMPGTYYVLMRVAGVSINNPPPNPAASGTNLMSFIGGTSYSQPTSGTSVVVYLEFRCTINDVTSPITIPAFTATSLSSVAFKIFNYDPDLASATL